MNDSRLFFTVHMRIRKADVLKSLGVSPLDGPYKRGKCCAGGMYTNTNPELRRVVPDAKGRTTVKVVYVVLEAQYQSALTTAVKNINAKRDNVTLSP